MTKKALLEKIAELAKNAERSSRILDNVPARLDYEAGAVSVYAAYAETLKALLVEANS